MPSRESEPGWGGWSGIGALAQIEARIGTEAHGGKNQPRIGADELRSDACVLIFLSDLRKSAFIRGCCNVAGERLGFDMRRSAHLLFSFSWQRRQSLL